MDRERFPPRARWPKLLPLWVYSLECLAISAIAVEFRPTYSGTFWWDFQEVIHAVTAVVFFILGVLLLISWVLVYGWQCCRFRFSLRTVFVLMTLLGCVLGWVESQRTIVRQRRQTWEWVAGHYNAEQRAQPSSWSSVYDGAPLTRRLLGDQRLNSIVVDPNTFSNDDVARIQRVFPEAVILGE